MSIPGDNDFSYAKSSGLELGLELEINVRGEGLERKGEEETRLKANTLCNKGESPEQRA